MNENNRPKLKILFDEYTLVLNNISENANINTLRELARLILNITRFKEIKQLSVSKKRTVQDMVFIQSVKLNHNEYKLKNKDTVQLEANIMPKDHNEKITWESSNTKYATVTDNGLVTSKSNNGNSTITVTCGGVSDTCYIICSNKSLFEEGGEEEIEDSE